jgi:hypothetical protein
VYVHSAEGGGFFPRGFLETGSIEEIQRHDSVRTQGAYPWDAPVALQENT